jgi:hypothetical protein
MYIFNFDLHDPPLRQELSFPHALGIESEDNSSVVTSGLKGGFKPFILTLGQNIPFIKAVNRTIIVLRY